MTRVQIGAKSVAALSAFVGCGVWVFRMDLLSIQYLEHLSHNVAFYLGLWSMLLGTSFYSYWRVAQKSRLCFVYTSHQNATYERDTLLFRWGNYQVSVGRNLDSKAWEFPPVVRRLLYVGILFFIGLMTMQNRGFELLSTISSRIGFLQSRYCVEAGQADLNMDPELKPECRLLVRAFKLGYAKDLGSCEPQKAESTLRTICDLRREDEPYLYYTWRLLHSFVNASRTLLTLDNVAASKKKLETQLEHWPTLVASQTNAILSAARASHHIWTNLPYPDDWVTEKVREVFYPSHCLQKLQHQTNTVDIKDGDERAKSKTLDHIRGHLLHNPRFKTSVGFCKEYFIHWGSPSSTCDDIVHAPQEVFRRLEISDQLDFVLDRRDVRNELSMLNRQISEIEGGVLAEHAGGLSKDSPDVVSFQCFMETDTQLPQVRADVIDYKGSKFPVRQVAMPTMDFGGELKVSFYREFGRLLEKKFFYNQYTSRAGATSKSANLRGRPEFKGKRYVLTKLDLLKDIDIFVGHEWVPENPGLLEVYPFHLHLKNFVDNFRQKYQMSRGRL
jgi:hypothetical protein